RVQIGGPTGAFVIIVYNGIAQYGYDGMLLATFMAGFMLIFAGYARFGQVIKFIPHPVITGFTAGIAVIIASSQINDFFGLGINNIPADFIPKWMMYLTHFQAMHLPSLAIGLIALALIVLTRRFTPKLPSYLIAVVVTALLVALFNIPTATIGSHFPNIPTGIPMPSLPDISFERMHEVLPLALTIAFLAGIESLLSAVIADGMTGFKHRSNQELIGQGVANIASTLCGGMPATGAIARTVTNVKSGGTTPIAGLFNAVFILLFMLCASDYMSFVPMAALAAILFVVAWGMSEIHHVIHILKQSGSDRLILLLTFSLTVLVDLTTAIAVGVILASLIFMREMSKAVVITDEAETNQRTDLPKGVEVFRISGPLFFPVVDELLDMLQSIGQVPKILILRMSRVPFLDGTGVSTIVNLVNDFHAKGTRVILSGAQNQPREFLNRANVKNLHFTENYLDAIKLAETI
nr:SulP family inorganic anion transporter [Pseudomonadota bacterium]